MTDHEAQLLRILGLSSRDALGKQAKAFDAMVADEAIQAQLTAIAQNTRTVIENWKLKARIFEIKDQHILLTNGTVGKAYAHPFRMQALGLDDIVYWEIDGLEAVGLAYDIGLEQVLGTPTQSGDIALTFRFRIEGEAEDAPLNDRKMMLIINPNPRSLWKDLPSEQNDPYWRADQAFATAPFLDKHLLAISKRGRAHANVGGFRDDDFSFGAVGETGWFVAAIADGAGSAKYAREGAHVACQSVLSTAAAADLAQLETQIIAINIEKGEEIQRELNLGIYNLLGGMARSVHNALEARATEKEMELKDLHSTLVFVVAKHFEFGYVLLTFSVGDCPVAVVSTEEDEVHLLNRLDVGEFGGGTRFITMPEIFTSDRFTTRFGYKIVPDFSALFLMTDGIYDPKFEVEANLTNIDSWRDFLADLRGKNEGGHIVDFKSAGTPSPELEQQCFDWIDFWSPGNNDDRTIIIIS